LETDVLLNIFYNLWYFKIFQDTNFCPVLCIQYIVRFSKY